MMKDLKGCREEIMENLIELINKDKETNQHYYD